MLLTAALALRPFKGPSPSRAQAARCCDDACREVADPAVAGPFASASLLPSLPPPLPSPAPAKFWGYAKKRAFTLIRADLDTSADVIGANLGRKRRFLLSFLADAPRQACVWKKRGNGIGGSDIEKNSFVSTF